MLSPQKKKYNIPLIEKKWQDYWAKIKAFCALDDSPKPPFYVLEMFPYPSGTLHMGHARNYTIGDVMARHAWAKGYNVLHPMGWDAFGMPAENAALKNGIHPKDWTYHNTYVMKEQCQKMGFSHDWSREIFSCDPRYYQHEQKMFLDFYEKGLAYRKKSYVNWDPVENSVLANEQVIEGRGWRSGALVEKKLLEQWFLKTTHFNESLLDDLNQLSHWPESVKRMQINWIGRSVGAIITFFVSSLESTPDEKSSPASFEIFTTRADTLYGATFCALSPDHPLAIQWAQSNAFIADFIAVCKQTSTSERGFKDKKGIDTGYRARHPFLKDVFLPIYIANFVLMDYGTGAIYGTPAHDQRDFEFAQTHNLPIIPVIEPFAGPLCNPLDKAYEEQEGVMMNSGPLNGLTPAKAREQVMKDLGALARPTITYRLKDWGIGRQRYWGAPIPIIHCPHCGIVPVPAKDLPVTLPEDVTFDIPGNPLDRHPTWKHVSCPKCHHPAQRETDTFDTFMESSWYFGRFCDPHNTQKAFSEKAVNYWMPVQQYIGGIEHAILHLLYARFVTKALSLCGYWKFSEPFQALFTQGMVCHQTFQKNDGTWLYPHDIQWKDGKAFYAPKNICEEEVRVGKIEKMSKSKCNVVDVSSMVDVYGADAVRLFLISDTPPARDIEWTEEGIEGAWRYVNRVWNVFHEKIALCQELFIPQPSHFSETALALRKATHQTIDLVDQAIEKYELNKYVAYLREYTNTLAHYNLSAENLEKENNADQLWALKEGLITFVQLLAPIMPHIAEEMGSLLGLTSPIHLHAWPLCDQALRIEDHVTMAVQINGKTRGTLQVPLHANEEDIRALLQKNPIISKYLKGKWDRFIIIPHRMISLVVSAHS